MNIKNKTIFILDWDDTLYPTSYLITNKSYDNINYLYKLDQILSIFIKKILNLGKVIIVTNATKSWVENTILSYPITSNIILNNIEIYSARDLFANKYSLDICKAYTFKLLLTNLIKKKYITNIYSIGDQLYEYNALVELNNLDTNILLKSIKLIDKPSIDDLIKQIEIMNENIHCISNRNKHVDLLFKNKIKPCIKV